MHTTQMTPAARPTVASQERGGAAYVDCEPSRFGIFDECPHCGGEMNPEHAHYRCGSCGWRDSCCD